MSCPVPICNPMCVNGTCIKPDTCKCEPEFYGDLCDKSCNESTNDISECNFKEREIIKTGDAKTPLILGISIAALSLVVLGVFVFCKKDYISARIFPKFDDESINPRIEANEEIHIYDTIDDIYHPLPVMLNKQSM